MIKNILKNKFLLISVFLILYFLGSICSQFALYSQLTPEMENSPYWIKLLNNEFFASLQWTFTLPAFRIGIEYLSAPQIFLVGYIIGFIVQIGSYIFWLKQKIPFDDYITISLMIFALYISKYKIFD